MGRWEWWEDERVIGCEAGRMEGCQAGRMPGREAVRVGWRVGDGRRGMGEEGSSLREGWREGEDKALYHDSLERVCLRQTPSRSPSPGRRYVNIGRLARTIHYTQQPPMGSGIPVY